MENFDQLKISGGSSVPLWSSFDFDSIIDNIIFLVLLSFLTMCDYSEQFIWNFNELCFPSVFNCWMIKEIGLLNHICYLLHCYSNLILHGDGHVEYNIPFHKIFIIKN